jgi:uncharacterized protein (TIGR02145 family)
MQISKNDLKEYIGQNRIDEVFVLLSQRINEYLSDENDKSIVDLKNTLINNLSRYNDLVMNQKGGLLNIEEYNRIKSQVIDAIFFVIDKLPDGAINPIKQNAEKKEFTKSQKSQQNIKIGTKSNLEKNRIKESLDNELNQIEESAKNANEELLKQKQTQKSEELIKKEKDQQLQSVPTKKPIQKTEQSFRGVKNTSIRNQTQQQPNSIKAVSKGFKINSKISLLVSFLFIVLFILFKFAWQPWKTKNKEVPAIKFNNLQYSTVQKSGTFIDVRDAMQYKTVKIGNQVWMAENLAYKPKFGNYWAYNNDESNITNYGYLYDWEAAKRSSPIGWHLPSKEDFETLLKITGGEGNAAYNSLIINGNSGFSAQFIGWRINSGGFLNFGNGAHFWSSSPGDNYQTWGLLIDKKTSEARIYESFSSFGFSVRCIQDK